MQLDGALEQSTVLRILPATETNCVNFLRSPVPEVIASDIAVNSAVDGSVVLRNTSTDVVAVLLASRLSYTLNTNVTFEPLVLVVVHGRIEYVKGTSDRGVSTTSSFSTV